MRYRFGVGLLCWVLSSGAAVAAESAVPAPISADKLEALRDAAGEDRGAVDTGAGGDQTGHSVTRPNLRHLPPDASVQAADARERAIGAAVRSLLQSQTR